MAITYQSNEKTLTHDLINQAKADKATIYANVGILIEVSPSKLKNAFAENDYVSVIVRRETATNKILTILLLKE